MLMLMLMLKLATDPTRPAFAVVGAGRGLLGASALGTEAAGGAMAKADLNACLTMLLHPYVETEHATIGPRCRATS